MPGEIEGLLELNIRSFQDEDFDALVALWHSVDMVVWYNRPERDIALWRKTPSAEIFVGELEERIVASTCVGHDGHRGWLYYVAVDPGLHGHGIGRRMVRFAERWLQQQGVPKVHVMIRPGNRNVEGFYRHIGYETNPCSLLQRWLIERGEAPSDTAGKETTSDRLEVTITYLEMTARPTRPPPPAPGGHRLALLRAEPPTVSFYRYLYNEVGRPWLWYERRMLDDEALAAIIQDEQVEIYVLYVDGVPAGYAELDLREAPDITLAYFGLMPEFIGRGMGPYLLGWAIDTAWAHEPKRLLVNTNTLDHPKALPLYQRFGFRPVRQVTMTVDDPRKTGVIPE
jgi:GNAT superfamily N-acetyltransferase